MTKSNPGVPPTPAPVLPEPDAKPPDDIPILDPGPGPREPCPTVPGCTPPDTLVPIGADPDPLIPDPAVTVTPMLIPGPEIVLLLPTVPEGVTESLPRLLLLLC